MAPEPAGLDLHLAAAQLSREGLAPVGDLSWLRESFARPREFWRRLVVHGPGGSALVKSVPLVRYDFFHDAVVRHLANGAPALRWFDPLAGPCALSYAELGRTSARKAAAWARAGAAPGQCVCILGRPGPAMATSLLAALKLGLIVSFLPSDGLSFLRRRLGALAPDFVATDELYVPLLPAGLALLPEPELAAPSDEDLGRSATYPSGAVAARLFAPWSPTPGVPVDLGADEAYLCPLRDGRLALGLGPGRALAAPGFNFLETEPALLLACLLNGATYVHLDADWLARDVGVLEGLPLAAMGVTCALRDQLVALPREHGWPWERWFRNPSESLDLPSWQSFVEAAHLDQALALNLRWEAARGGCSLFSVGRRGRAHLGVLPSAGVPWSLVDLMNPESEPRRDFGLFTPRPLGLGEAPPPPATTLLARQQAEYLVAGSSANGRAGRTYPVAEVLEALGSWSSAVCVALCRQPLPGPALDPLFTALVFTGGGACDEAPAREALARAVERELGLEFVPDSFAFFPLWPRRAADGSLDQAWCADQYVRGRLHRMRRDEARQLLGQLRQHAWDRGR